MYRHILVYSMSFARQLVFPIGLCRKYQMTHQVLFSNSNTLWNDSVSHLKMLLKNRFPKATTVEVEDISGGCGSMFEVHVESIDFENLSRVKQHKLITETLKKEIKDMHGLRISTATPKDL